MWRLRDLVRHYPSPPIRMDSETVVEATIHQFKLRHYRRPASRRLPYHHPPHVRESIPFVLGGLFIARTEFLQENDFPDRGMTKWLDDVLLGEMVLQVHGQLATFPKELLTMFKMGAGERRGTEFSDTSGRTQPDQRVQVTRTGVEVESNPKAGTTPTRRVENV